MKKLRAITEISAFVLVGTATEKIVLPNVKKQIGIITKYEVSNPFYKTKKNIDNSKKPPKRQRYFFSFYKQSLKTKPFVFLKQTNSSKSFKSFLKSKEKWMDNNTFWDQKRMGYSSWDRFPEFFGWVIWIEKPGQFKSFVEWLKRMKVLKK